MFTNVIKTTINAEVVVKNLMTAVIVLGFVVMILMLVAGTISMITSGITSKEASVCGVIALCAGAMVFCACYYVNMH